ncbi:MAG: hypothetical protein ABFD04_00925 [Syntrophomonas sp.]
MAYWLYCQSCMQWSKSATGLSEDKSCPLCNNLFMKTKPYSVPNNASESSFNQPERQQASPTNTLLIEKKTIKTSSSRRDVETPATAGDKSQFQEAIEEEKAQEAATAVCQKYETIELKEVPDEEESEKDEEVVDWELEVDEEVKAEELEEDADLAWELSGHDNTQTDSESGLRELPEEGLISDKPEQGGGRLNFLDVKSESLETNQKLDLSDIPEQSSASPIAAEVAKSETYEMPGLSEIDEEALREELKECEEVGIEEWEEDDYLVSVDPEKNIQPINSQDNGEYEPQESPEAGGMRINFRYEKTEFPEKNRKMDLSDILEQSGDSPIFVEVVEPGNFELHESAEQEEQVVDWELERDEEVGEAELEEDEDLIYDPGESDTCEAAEQFEAGSTAEGIDQPETIESAELVEPLSEQVEFSETSGEKQETSQETITVSDEAETPSTSDAPDPETAGPAGPKASLTPELSELQPGEMNQTIVADSSEADELVNIPAQSDNYESLEATDEQETPEESETPEIIERAADCEPAPTIMTDEALEVEETAESYESNTEENGKQELADSAKMLEGPDTNEGFYESPNRAKMTRVHERYIEMMRRIRNPIQPQL